MRRVLDLTPRRTTPGPVSLPDAIQRVFDLVGWRASRKGVALHLQVDGDVRQVLGDQNEIIQIFTEPRHQRDRRHGRGRAP